MPAYYDEKQKTWFCKFYYTDYTGTRKQKLKRGFALQRDAKEWENDFLAKKAAQPSMSLKALSELYLEDKKENCKLITYESKKNRIDTWILPYFADKPVDSITAVDIRKWQVELKNATGHTGNKLSPGYMQNIVMELSCMFNYAVRFYGLTVNPCHVAGNTVGKKQKSMNFWTKDEFDQFIATFDKKDPYYTIFLILYYCGLRIGELQALTIADINTEAGFITINKTYRMINGKGNVTPPKTPKANRTITIPPFLSDRIKDYISMIYKPEPDCMPFVRGKTTFARVLDDHAAKAGIKRIRVHDLRHSHASLLIELGFSALLVSERLGHESVSTTLNIYSHLFPSKQSEVADKLQALCKENTYF